MEKQRFSINRMKFIVRKRESPSTLKGLSELADNRHLVVTTPDNNLGLVINDTSWYIDELNRRLADRKVYVEIGNCALEDITQISKMIYLICKSPLHNIM